MLSKVNPWQALAALGLITGAVVTLAVTGHKADVGFVATGVALVLTSILNVFKQGGAS